MASWLMAGAACIGLTRKTRLAHLPPPPVQVIALLAYPVAWLVLNRPFVPSVHDRRLLWVTREVCARVSNNSPRDERKVGTNVEADQSRRSHLTRLRQRLVIGPEHEDRREWVARDVLYLAPHCERTAGRRQYRVLRRGQLRVYLRRRLLVLVLLCMLLLARSEMRDARREREGCWGRRGRERLVVRHVRGEARRRETRRGERYFIASRRVQSIQCPR